MRPVSQLLILLTAAFAPQALAAPQGHYHASGGQGASVGKAVYFITNNQQNAIVALRIGKDGTLSNGSVTATGGAGSNSINGATNQPAGPDALVSQSALTVAGKNIFVVNAGSNSVSMFAISPSDPTKLTLVGKPATIPGEFPNTVAASTKNKLVCVGSTGAKAGISCASFSASGLGSMDDLRPFNLNQTTPPVGPTNTVSHTFFSLDENTLFTTVKGNPKTNDTGFLSAFPVQSCGSERDAAATVSRQDTRSSPAGTLVLFGSQPIPESNSLFVTDASFGAAVLDITPPGAATLAAKESIPGQKATCWSTISPATKTAFVTDAGLNRIIEMSLSNAAIVGQTDLSADGDPGLIDLAAAGEYLYALSPGNGTTQAAVAVLDVSGGAGTAKIVQHFQLGGLGAGKNAQGMAVLV